ncbi:enoyl-CoA hydratase/isomerase (macronuclear) [Tetrahymena thermophila SB210]|uniref:Enoyl-CoA hydratase/isomerase n=1 Tax=Tetrahymena thermophila (strain SB210) TaxID=312017 RepID=I7MCX2_TETTS|nr:enoyl-CoA hydratase/isomerase [Tetrahymena thermophila SB210]EAR85087.1 enoyl-CoA hydratase/isomerase [Tetrahymena thermophila SB210]|eukprot:XP_001032750.1 enoyl-CoA hydratase/isomerase [Tetrahymena thermophila SB210]
MANPGRFNIEHICKQLNITEEERKQDVFLKKTESGVFFLVLNKKANTLSIPFIRKISELLDTVEENDGPTALVTFGLHEKFFSTGLDLNFMLSLEKEDIFSFILEVIRLYGRFLALAVPCIAMMNGHAYAGGCMLAFSHDYRIMRDDFGQICMNEVELHMPLPPGMNAVIQEKISDKDAFRELVLQAKRFEAKEAFERKMVNKIFPPEKLFEETLKFAESQTKFGVDKPNFRKLKEEMNKTAIDCCFNKGHGVGVRYEAKATFPNPRL